MSMYDEPQFYQLYQLLHKNNRQLQLDNKCHAVLQETILFQREIINETEKTVNETFTNLKKKEAYFYNQFDKTMYEATVKHVEAAAEKLADEKFNKIASRPEFKSQLRLMVAKTIENILDE